MCSQAGCRGCMHCRLMLRSIVVTLLILQSHAGFLVTARASYEAVGSPSSQNTKSEEFRRCTDGGKNTSFEKDTLLCVFGAFASHCRHVAKRRIQSGRWGEHPHPRIWMRLWRIINTACDAPASLGRGEAQGCSSTSVFFLSITKKTIIHLLFFSPISVHFRPVACIVRLPKWFVRLKSLQMNMRP